jgi:antitoxin YefM
MRLMNATSTVSLRQVIDQVNQDADYTLIADDNTSGAVVMSLDTFNSLMETVHLLREPANAAHLQRSIEQDRRGERFQRELVDA